MDPSSFTHGIEKTGGSDMNSRERVVRLGIDIGKNSFHLWGVNRATRPAGVTPALSGGGKGAHGRGQPAARVVRGEWHGGRQERCRRFWKISKDKSDARRRWIKRLVWERGNNRAMAPSTNTKRERHLPTTVALVTHARWQDRSDRHLSNLFDRKGLRGR